MAEPAFLPRGTVTFLFTDIEGSTRRWQQDSVAMAHAVARQFTLLRDAVTRHGGVLFKVVGDAAQAAFPTAPAALAAALDAQQALHAEPWPEPIDKLSVRMALHTGEAQPDAMGDYLAPALNRLARLLASGHGGQILLAQATADLVRAQLPRDVQLRDLGRHALRDFADPEAVFQVIHPDLPGDFPPLATVQRSRVSLPTPATPFLGRIQDVARVVALLRTPHVRLVTLTGPGGVGKTRLAIEAAEHVVDHFPDGVVFVDLAPVRDPTLVLATIAATLGVREQAGRPFVETLSVALTGQRLLLVLDNGEQVLDAAPDLATLLAAVPTLSLLATSRARLVLRAEHEVPLAPMAVVDPTQLPTLSQLDGIDSIQLFIARAQAFKPGFALTSENAPAVAGICARLDGLPLAIELAAARIKLLSPDALAQRLERRLPLLTGGARDLPARQRTLRDTIAWSYDLLSLEEQVLFARLAVFVGGGTLDAIDAVANPDGALDVFGGIASLVDKSLVRLDDAGAEPRYQMLETIREFALDRLTASGEEAATRDRHAGYVHDLALRAEPDLALGRFADGWFARLDDERGNVRTALSWDRDQGAAEQMLATVGAVVEYWCFRGDFGEGRAWCDQALALADDRTPRAARIAALYGVTVLAAFQGDGEPALAAGRAMLDLARACSTPLDQVRANLALCLVERRQGAFAGAAEHAQAALAQARAIGATGWAGWCLVQLSLLAGDEAAASAAEALALFRAAGSEWGQVNALGLLAAALARAGDLRQAAQCYADSLELRAVIDNRWGTVDDLVGIAELAAISRDDGAAARLLGAAHHWAAELGYRILHPAGPDPLRQRVRARLGDVAFEQAWREGQRLLPGDAVRQARALLEQLGAGAGDVSA